MYENTTQQGNGSSGDESLPGSGLAASPAALPPDSAAGTLGPEQENNLSGDDFFFIPGTSKNPINLDPEGVLVTDEPFRVGFVPEQPWGILYDFTNNGTPEDRVPVSPLVGPTSETPQNPIDLDLGSSAEFSDAEEGADFSKNKNSLSSEAAS